MHEQLRKEIETFEKRTPKSAAAHKHNLQRLPLGVASNYRAYDPYPIFVKDAQRGKFRDLDGNEYIDHNLCFGALMAGHCHPAVMKAVEKRLSTGTMFGMPHDMEWELADEICARFPLERCASAAAAPRSTMHSVRLARAAHRPRQDHQDRGRLSRCARRRARQREAEGERSRGDHRPASGPGGLGVPKEHRQRHSSPASTIWKASNAASSNSTARSPAVILEPIMMNVGICMPEPGFLEGLRALCPTWRAADLRRGEDWRKTRPWRRLRILRRQGRHHQPGQVDWRRFPPGRLRSHQRGDGRHRAPQGVPRRNLHHQSRVMAAGLATFREVLTRDDYAHVEKLSHNLVNGYHEILEGTASMLTSHPPAPTARSCYLPRESATTATGLSGYGPLEALLVRHGEPRRHGATLLVG